MTFPDFDSLYLISELFVSMAFYIYTSSSELFIIALSKNRYFKKL